MEYLCVLLLCMLTSVCTKGHKILIDVNMEMLKPTMAPEVRGPAVDLKYNRELSKTQCL